jgi:hypothetical protein
MKKILGTGNEWNLQTNDGSFELLKDYGAKHRAIACGPNAFVSGLEIQKWPNLSAPGEQWPDSIIMIMHNTKNIKAFQNRRDIDLDKYPPNEIPQLYDVVADILYGKKGNKIRFKWGLSKEIIINAINSDICLMVCGDFPTGGHYVLINGYEDDNIVFMDSYPNQWPDRNGKNRRMTFNTALPILNKWRIEIPKYK